MWGRRVESIDKNWKNCSISIDKFSDLSFNRERFFRDFYREPFFMGIFFPGFFIPAIFFSGNLVREIFSRIPLQSRVEDTKTDTLDSLSKILQFLHE